MWAEVQPLTSVVYHFDDHGHFSIDTSLVEQGQVSTTSVACFADRKCPVPYRVDDEGACTTTTVMSGASLTEGTYSIGGATVQLPFLDAAAHYCVEGDTLHMRIPVLGGGVRLRLVRCAAGAC